MLQLLLSQNVSSVLKGSSPARDTLGDGKHDPTVIHEIVALYDDHVPVDFLLQLAA